MKLSIDLSKNVKKLSSILDSDDIISFNFNLKDRLATAIYTESLADKTMLGKQVVEPISKISSKDINDYLKSVTLPESIVEIGECSFYGCSLLPEVTLPERSAQEIA